MRCTCDSICLSCSVQAVMAATAREVERFAQAALAQLPAETGPLAADAAARRQPDGSYLLPVNPYRQPGDPERGDHHGIA